MARQQRAKKYLVRNTTVKPPRVDPKTGKDLRTAIERVGHGVSWRDELNNPIIVHPGKNPRLVGEITEGLLRLQQGGLVHIEEVDNLVTKLKEHHTLSESQNKANTAAEKRATAANQPSDPRRATASAMGQEAPKDTSRESKEYPGAVNPDGEPNFVVTAQRGKGQSQKRSGPRLKQNEQAPSEDVPSFSSSEGDTSEA